jgi:alcohol dehydrogenase YqhD (iron-dependent ADH family)
MENFIIYNPVKLHFGRDVVENLGETVKLFGTKVLLIYGGGSVKKNGSYDDVMGQLKSADCEVFEYYGIKPNPVLDDVQKAIQLGIEQNVELIIALGGGSVIDSAKVVSVCITENLNPWEVMKGKVIPKKEIPLLCILTLAATGTEMNAAAVVQNPETNEKIGFVHPLMYPKHSFLNPVYTFSVSPEYTAYGIVDLIAHSFEAFFAKGDSSLADRFVQSIVLEAMRYANLVLQEPENYDYRANVLLQSTCALNGITAYGRVASGDWGVHNIGHVLSMLYDVPHGASLSIAYPAWLQLQKDRIPERVLKLAKLIFNVSSIDDFLLKLKSFFKSIKAPVLLSEIGISKEKKSEILELLIKNKASGYNHRLTDADFEKIVDFML